MLTDLDKCNPIPKSAPTMDKVEKSKSQKVLKIDDMYFFVAETKDQTIIYSIDLGIQLLATFPRSHALNMLVKRLPIIKGVIDGRGS